jgi:hypothetical protein
MSDVTNLREFYAVFTKGIIMEKHLWFRITNYVFELWDG